MDLPFALSYPCSEDLTVGLTKFVDNAILSVEKRWLQ